MSKRKVVIIIASILLFLSPFILIDVIKNTSKNEKDTYRDESKETMVSKEISKIETGYEPLNDKKYDDTDKLNECLDAIDKYFTFLNEEMYGEAFEMINKESLEYMDIDVDSFKAIISNEYPTKVGYNLKDFKKINNEIYLCRLKTFNEQFGEEQYSSEDIFDYDENFVINVNDSRISLNGFIYIQGEYPGKRKIEKDKLIISIRNIYKYLDRIIVEIEVENLQDKGSISLLDLYSLRGHTENEEIYFNKKIGIDKDYEILPKTMKKMLLEFDVNFKNNLTDINLIRR
ncbi:hypothetical protein [Wukongibacter baidiensis]